MPDLIGHLLPARANTPSNAPDNRNYLSPGANTGLNAPGKLFRAGGVKATR